jgi:thiamine-phosphate pyrophosphorylase
MSDVVTECLEAGCPAIQLRDKEASASELHRQALELRELTRSRGALLFINDRLDVALAVGADGVHLGPDDIPVDAVRRHVGHHFLIGYSTDDPQLGSKPGLEEEAVGPARVGEVARASGLPCLGIGGITADNAGAVAAQGAGVAVLGAAMHARCPGEEVGRLLSAVTSAIALRDA